MEEIQGQEQAVEKSVIEQLDETVRALKKAEAKRAAIAEKIVKNKEETGTEQAAGLAAFTEGDTDKAGESIKNVNRLKNALVKLIVEQEKNDLELVRLANLVIAHADDVLASVA